MYDVCTFERKIKVPENHFRLNITQLVKDLVGKSGIKEGYVLIQTKHTTTAITPLLIQEDERGLMNDLFTWLGKIIPEGYYQHDDFSIRTENIGPNEKKNATAHLKASLFHTSIQLVVSEGQPSLGTWQSILFLDFDSNDRPFRTIIIQVLGKK